MPDNKDIRTEAEQIEIRSEDVQEILGQIPNWLIRWGITVILFFVVALLVGSWFFKYPDIISSRVVITTENPPAAIVARLNGKLKKLFVSDQQKVREGDYLAIIENTAEYEDVKKLDEMLDSIGFTFWRDSILDLQFDRSFQLGELQDYYSAFVMQYAEYKSYIEMNIFPRKIANAAEQVKNYNALYNQMNRQTWIQSEELEIEKKQFDRSTSLFKKEVLAESDFEQAKAKYLQKKLAWESSKTNAATTRLQISQMEQVLIELESEYQAEKMKREMGIKESHESLLSNIKLWKQNNLLIAPISGIVTFTEYWSVNQNVKAGDRVLTVVPEDEGVIIGKLSLPIVGSGKVKVGQRVNIRLDNFPYLEYGMVQGIVKTISLVTSDNNYVVELELPANLTTNYGKQLEFSQEMQGSAEIITEDLRLLVRFLDPLRSIWEEHSE